MKFFVAFSMLLCTCALVQSKFSYSDFVDAVKEYFDSEESDSDAEGEFKRDFNMGDGSTIGLRTFADMDEEGVEREEEEEEAEEPISKGAEKRRRKAEQQERDLTDEYGDYTDHDCLNIRTYTKENWYAEPWNTGLSFKKFRGPMAKRVGTDNPKSFAKYNSAYGIPMIGSPSFSDDAMLRGCYLLRYIFADNMYLRIAARRKGVFNYGFQGGRCCPPQMNNPQLTCMCETGAGGWGFPIKGKGAPAHEMAHYFYKYLLPDIVREGNFKLPEFVNQKSENGKEWQWQPVFSEDGKRLEKCTNNEKLVERYGDLYTWAWNAQKQDLLREKTKIKMCKMHHYFIYAGQQNWLFKGNEQVREKSRKCMYEKSANLHNLMKKLWPCNNDYIPTCKDAAYQFQYGLAQNMKIGKPDPVDPSEMACRDIDSPQVTRDEIPPIEQPKEDGTSVEKCLVVGSKINKDLSEQPPQSFRVNEWAKYLRDDQENAWYLRRCCAKTMNFDNTQPQNEEKDPTYEYNDGTCRGDLFDSDDLEKMNEDDFDSAGGDDDGDLALVE